MTQVPQFMYVHVYLCTFVTVWTCVEANHAALLYIFTFVMLFLLVVYSKVRVEGDGVFVKAETAKLAQFRQTMDMGKAQSADDTRTFLIIGGGTYMRMHTQPITAQLQLLWYPVVSIIQTWPSSHLIG